MSEEQNENQQQEDNQDQKSSDKSNRPKPPAGFQANDRNQFNSDTNQNQSVFNQGAQKSKNSVFNTRVSLSQKDSTDLQAIKRYSYFALGCAGVSFIIGGLLLSLISVVFAYMAYSKTKQFCSTHESSNDEDIKALCVSLKKYCKAVLVFTGIVLALTLVVIALVYPYLEQIIATGDYSSILSGSATSSSVGTSSTWG